MFSSTTVPGVSAAASTLSNPIAAVVNGQTTNAFDELLKATPPALVAFLANLPAIDGNVITFLLLNATDISILKDLLCH